MGLAELKFRMLGHIEGVRGKLPRTIIANASVRNARTIGIADSDHFTGESMLVLRELIVSRPNDIFLVEGVERGEPANELLEFLGIPSRPNVFGWDNQQAHVQSLDLANKTIDLAIRHQSSSIRRGRGDEFSQLQREQNEILQSLKTLYQKRDQSLFETYRQMRENFPNKRIIIFAGEDHLARNKKLLHEMRKQPYSVISFQPKTKPMQPDALIQASREYYSPMA